MYVGIFLALILYSSPLFATDRINQCAVCHINDSHFVGKGEILSRWASTAKSLERTGHYWFKPEEFKKLSKKFMAWSQPQKSFYQSLKNAENSEFEKEKLSTQLEAEIVGFSTIGDLLQTDFSSAQKILEYPFHALQLKSKNLSYVTTVTTRLQKILMVFGGSSEVRNAKFNFLIDSSSNETFKGAVELQHLTPIEKTSAGLFEIDQMGNLLKLQREGQIEDPLLQNCAWLFQRPELATTLPLNMKRPIALETGKVLRQNEMIAQINIRDVQAQLHEGDIQLKVFYDFEPVHSGGQIKIIGGNGTASVDLMGILKDADAELAISLRVFGVDLKGWLTQQILQIPR